MTPKVRRRRRVDRESGSSVLAEISPMKMRVGSDLQPAPMEEMTGRECLWQYSRSATLLSMLSIASTM